MNDSQELNNTSTLAEYKEHLRAEHDSARTCFLEHLDARKIVTERSTTIDRLLIHLWETHLLGTFGAALVAVGGYGRGELHPYSDVDITIILADDPSESTATALQNFVTVLWDLGLDIGHSVRTIDQTLVAATDDITVMTNLLESRLLAGEENLLLQITEKIETKPLWSSSVFYAEKIAEQNARYRKFDDAFQQLEPNVKESPGGLRDIQTIAWVANRHFASVGLANAGLSTLQEHEFLTQEEFQALFDGETFLWRVRCALHFLTGRHEDRLSFDHQKSVANMLGYHGDTPNAAVENLMKDYYRTVRELSCLNEMLLGLFDEAIVQATKPLKTQPINRRFQLVNGALDVTKDSVFKRYPYAMLELFLVLQQNPDVTHIRARTIRLLLSNKHRIDETCRNDLKARTLFMEIIRQPRRIGHELQRMHKYGILSAYLPVIAKVEGLMQFDLFHIYTVDEHALFVLRYMRRFSFPENESDKIALVPYVIENIPKLELLYVAGLYHDIAKGRDGDHSQLGADDVAEFCQQHGFSNFDTHLVAWLVRNHLLMSTISQRKDIYDASVIDAFADEVGQQIYLDYLYLLTIADMRGTNPQLFNGWKETLLSDLYTATRRHLSSTADLKRDSSERVSDMKTNALAHLKDADFEPSDIESLWGTLDERYFLRHRAQEIAWHARMILSDHNSNEPLVSVENFPDRAATAIFIYTPDSSNLFARTTAALDKLHLDIQDARISTSANGFTLDTYIVLDASSGGPISDPIKIKSITEKVKFALRNEAVPLPPLTRGATRAIKNFATPTLVDFEYDEVHNYTVMGVNTLDKPGVLCILGEVMREFNIDLHDARIATIGERAEDYFCITLNETEGLNRAERGISVELQSVLRSAIVTALETH